MFLQQDVSPSSKLQTCEIYRHRIQEEEEQKEESGASKNSSEETPITVKTKFDQSLITSTTNLEETPITSKRPPPISSLFESVTVAKSPLADHSPASVLNPPNSSKKRKTITDYFGH